MPRSAETTFYEWEEYGQYWITREESFDQDWPSVPYTDWTKSVATWVIEDIFEDANLTIDSSSKQLIDAHYQKSSLPGYDIKWRDAYQMIQLSLATKLTDEVLLEPYADGAGVIHFYSIGVNTSSVQSNPISGDVFYSIESQQLTKQVDNVMIIGYDPPPKRYSIRQGQTEDTAEYDLLTFNNRVSQLDQSLLWVDPADRDYDSGFYPIYHVWGDVLGPEQCDYFREGHIEYGDTFFDQEKVLIDLGVIDPEQFETISTYIYKIEVPMYKQGSTNVSFSQRTPKFQLLEENDGTPTMGKIFSRRYTRNNLYVSEFCLTDDIPDAFEYGIRLPRSNEKKFLGVKDVYLYGYRIKQLNLDYYQVDEERIDGPARFLIDMETKLKEPIRLTRGQDYIIVDDPTDDTYYKIIFMSDIHPDYQANFGGNVNSLINAKVRTALSSIYKSVDDGTLYHADSTTPIYVYDPDYLVTGYLRDGVTEVDNLEVSTEVIFPTSEGRAGVAIDKIVMIYDWDNPCITITDERNTVTSANMQQVSVSFFPIIIQDRPAPIAVNGELLNHNEVVPDYYTDTEENLAATTFERAHLLENGDIKLTLPFADEDDCVNISNYIKEMVDEDRNKKQVTYTCSPESEPVLGEVIDGLTINSIDFSYQDAGQYVISVNAGPRWLGLSGWDTSIYANKTEQLQVEGIVTGVQSDNLTCQVKLPQIGVMECINASKEIVEKGDRVSVTVYNNPVSVSVPTTGGGR